ncbi:MAG: zinc-dependent alcohol dehydrogenase family protein [Gloeomargaritaceae cyanobacterium C42_A2020_066]|nr:zinc-dependent alcohol dehydrogenase family protein [Gloeomargaritaceae cyanobacterium C42_A2020_066]
MRAVVMTRAGGPEVLELGQVPDPQICQPMEVLVALEAAGLNPIDTKLRQRGTFYPEQMPAILGCDAAGRVVAVGSQVRDFQPGDAVYWCHGGLGQGGGSYAELQVLDARYLAPKPARLDFVQAAAVPLALITAWEALYDRARLTAGQTVLIHGGAGGVGHLAIQLAKLQGARVLTTVSSPEKGQWVQRLGADVVLYYRETDFVESVRYWTEGRGVDVALDTVGGQVFHATAQAVAHYGDLVTLLQPPAEGLGWEEARRRNLRIAFELMLTPQLANLEEALMHQTEILRTAGRLFDAGQLEIHVAQTFPLSQAAAAHRLLGEGRTQGKLVLVHNS